MTDMTKAEMFQASREKLAQLDASAHTFCCETHQKAFFSIKEKAAGTGEMSAKQMDFARDIYVGRCTHNGSTQSPDRMVKAYCVARVDGEYAANDGKGGTVMKQGLVPCGVEITGTAVEVGAWGTKCEEHRS